MAKAFLTFLNRLLPGWPDEARFIAQLGAFKEAAAGYELSGRCLDAGYGEGLYSSFLESFKGVCRIFNLDLNLSYAGIKKKISPRQRFVRGNLENLPFGDFTFECCLCAEVIEHISKDEVTLSELFRVIKPEGLLLVSVPLERAPYSPAHVRRGYTLEDLSRLLTKSGFEVKRYAHCCYLFMRMLHIFWQWQFSALGRNKRSLLPRFFILGLGYLDRYLRIGRPWDLVVLAKRPKR